jgi:hypothetical protein
MISKFAIIPFLGSFSKVQVLQPLPTVDVGCRLIIAQ